MHFADFSQKEFIVLGLIARNNKVLSTRLARLLQLTAEERLRSYTARLIEQGIIISRGNKKSTAFLINPLIIKNANVNIKTTLITIEPHRLEALIIEDLRVHPNSLINEIHNRLPDVDRIDLRKALYAMVGKGLLFSSGGRTYRKYDLA